MRLTFPAPIFDLPPGFEENHDARALVNTANAAAAEFALRKDRLIRGLIERRFGDLYTTEDLRRAGRLEKFYEPGTTNECIYLDNELLVRFFAPASARAGEADGFEFKLSLQYQLP